VTDAGLKHLADMKDLTDLFLHKSKVTDEGVNEFKKTLPGCRIHR
jgi:hypothetical protein